MYSLLQGMAIWPLRILMKMSWMRLTTLEVIIIDVPSPLACRGTNA